MPWVHFDRERRRIHVEEGTDLRRAALQEGVNVYPRPFNVLNCHGDGLCGKCQVRVLNPDSVEYRRKPINLLGLEINPNQLVMMQENLMFREKIPGFNHPLFVVLGPLLLGVFLAVGAFFVSWGNGVPVLSDLLAPLKLTTLSYADAWAFTKSVGVYEAVFYGSWVLWIVLGQVLSPLVWPDRGEDVSEQLAEEEESDFSDQGEVVLACQCAIKDDVRVRTLNEGSLNRPLAEYRRGFTPVELESKLDPKRREGGKHR